MREQARLDVYALQSNPTCATYPREMLPASVSEWCVVLHTAGGPRVGIAMHADELPRAMTEAVRVLLPGERIEVVEAAAWHAQVSA